MPASIDHVLLDADGVLQYLPGGWVDAMTPYLGDRAEAFLRDTWHDELPALRGEADYLEQLAQNLSAHGCETSVEELYPAVWHTISVVPETMALVRRLQDAGYGVHLGTNQERHRAAFMRTTMGYDAIFGTSVYSCEIGHAKPDPDYFRTAATMIDAAPESILFVDDRPDNVAGAREAGLRAERWEVDLGADDRNLPALESLLAGHGISLDG